MVQFRLIFDKKIRVKTIDDAEGTPGFSRQFTRFNAYCKPKIERAVNTPGIDYRAEIDNILEEYNFKVTKFEDESKLTIKITVESTED